MDRLRESTVGLEYDQLDGLYTHIRNRIVNQNNDYSCILRMKGLMK